MITVRAGYAKNGEARRVPMNQLLTDILKSVKLANNQGDRVFCNRAGTSYRSFRSAFERAVRKAEIVDFLVTIRELAGNLLKNHMPP